MAFSTLITLTVAGTDTGPFNLYSNIDGFLASFESGISKASLESGYLSTLVPDATTIIRVKSISVGCQNYTDLEISGITTTTTSTTSTTTTLALTKYCYEAIYQCDDVIHVPPGGSVTYYDEFGNPNTVTGLCDDGSGPIFTYFSSSPPVTSHMSPISCP